MKLTPIDEVFDYARSSVASHTYDTTKDSYAKFGAAARPSLAPDTAVAAATLLRLLCGAAGKS